MRMDSCNGGYNWSTALGLHQALAVSQRTEENLHLLVAFMKLSGGLDVSVDERMIALDEMYATLCAALILLGKMEGQPVLDSDPLDERELDPNARCCLSSHGLDACKFWISASRLCEQVCPDDMVPTAKAWVREAATLNRGSWLPLSIRVEILSALAEGFCSPDRREAPSAADAPSPSDTYPIEIHPIGKRRPRVVQPELQSAVV